MVLFSIRGSDESLTEDEMMAGASGLTDVLGWEPTFCGVVDPDSLVATWHHLMQFTFHATGYDVIEFMEVDETAVRPFEPSVWTNALETNNIKVIGDNTELFDQMFTIDNPHTAEFLLDASVTPIRAWSFDVARMVDAGEVGIEGLDDETLSALGSAAEGVKRALAFDEERQRKRLTEMLKRQQVDEGTELEDLMADASSPIRRYRLHDLITSGFAPFLWALVTDRTLDPALYGMDSLNMGRALGKEISRCLEKSGVACSHASEDDLNAVAFRTFHTWFGPALDSYATDLVASVAKRHGIGRNDPCPCGSGRKFKRCCAHVGMDELAGRWTRGRSERMQRPGGQRLQCLRHV